jgi:hypothetical protein
MRRGCFDALIVCALMNAAASAQGMADPPRQVDAVRQAEPQHAPDVDSCVSRLDPQLDIGYDRIAARCPELARQLDKGGWGPWLPRGWKEPGNDLSAGGLKEFRELVARESAATVPSRTPDVRHLKSVLTELAGNSREGGWSRFKSWLRSILERREETTDESWFTKMVAHVGVSQSLIRVIVYAALAAVVLLAAVILVNEARTAGLLPKPGALKRRGGTSVEGGTSAMAWSDIERAPLGDKPRLLLELIVRRLSDRGFLPPAGGLTVRELTKAVRLPEADDRARLADLALAAERVRYSAGGSQPAGLDESIARGRELLDRLNASTAG